MRDSLWSYCCALSHRHGARAAWAVFVMFDWLADRAEYVGDLVAVLANRENARIALATAGLAAGPRSAAGSAPRLPAIRQIFDGGGRTAARKRAFSWAIPPRIWHR